MWKILYFQDTTHPDYMTFVLKKYSISAEIISVTAKFSWKEFSTGENIQGESIICCELFGLHAAPSKAAFLSISHEESAWKNTVFVGVTKRYFLSENIQAQSKRYLRKNILRAKITQSQ